MRHIKLFEDYSDKELKDLMGDLEGIGHKYRLTQGEDFGFGKNLTGENNAGNWFYITEKAFKILEDKGISIFKFPGIEGKDIEASKVTGYGGEGILYRIEFMQNRSLAAYVLINNEIKAFDIIIKKLKEISL